MEHETEVPKYNRRNLYFSVAIVYVLFIAVGLTLGWASPSVPKLKDEGANFTSSQSSLISSLVYLAPGNLIVIFGLDTLGRRWTLLICWLSVFASPLMMSFSRRVEWLMAARFVSGWGYGAAFTVIGVYISEISDVGVRSPLNSATFIFLSVGVIISFSVGPFVSFVSYNIMCLILTSVFGLLWPFLPESPYHLVAKGEEAKAKEVLERLRLEASKDVVKEELDIIKIGIEEERRNRTTFIKLITSRPVLKQFMVSFYVLYLQAGTGGDPMTAYAQEMFDAAKLNFKGAYVPIVMTIWSICVTIPSPFLFKKFGTKPLLLFGGFGSGIGLTLLGINFILIQEDYDLSSFKYLPIIFDILFYTASFVGMGGCIWGIVSETFSPSVKALGTGLCGLFATFLSFVAIQLFGEIKERCGIGPALLGFGVVQMTASIGLFFIKDTSRMTLQEIQNYFEGKTSKKEKEISKL